jgi:hypothetical protein
MSANRSTHLGEGFLTKALASDKALKIFRNYVGEPVSVRLENSFFQHTKQQRGTYLVEETKVLEAVRDRMSAFGEGHTQASR